MAIDAGTERQRRRVNQALRPYALQACMKRGAPAADLDEMNSGGLRIHSFSGEILLGGDYSLSISECMKYAASLLKNGARITAERPRETRTPEASAEVPASVKAFESPARGIRPWFDHAAYVGDIDRERSEILGPAIGPNVDEIFANLSESDKLAKARAGHR